MIRHPCQLHAPGRLDDDREKQIELPVEPSASNMHRHPHEARLTVGAAVEDLDLSDDVSASVWVAIDEAFEQLHKDHMIGKLDAAIIDKEDGKPPSSSAWIIRTTA
jgi:hypothetical protein